MNFKLRLNYYRDEEGEYTEPEACDFNRLKQVIEKNWPNESYTEDLKIIHISNSSQENLILMNCKRGVFEVFYFRTSETHHFHKKSRIELILSSAKEFMHSNFSTLEKELNKTKKDRKYLRKNLLKSHRYTIQSIFDWKSLSWIGMGMPLGLMLNGIAIFSFINGYENGLIPFLLVFIFLAGIFFWIPGLFIHYQYYKDNKNLIIEITRGSNRVVIEHNGTKLDYNKNDIETVTMNETNKLNRIPWSDYGFTEIKFKSGELLNLTSLLVDQLFILDKFQCDNIKRYRVENDLPFLKQKTNLKQ